MPVALSSDQLRIRQEAAEFARSVVAPTANQIDRTAADPWNREISKDVSPAHGIPSMFVAYVQQASLIAGAEVHPRDR